MPASFFVSRPAKIRWDRSVDSYPEDCGDRADCCGADHALRREPFEFSNYVDGYGRSSTMRGHQLRDCRRLSFCDLYVNDVVLSIYKSDLALYGDHR